MRYSEKCDLYNVFFNLHHGRSRDTARGRGHCDPFLQWVAGLRGKIRFPLQITVTVSAALGFTPIRLSSEFKFLKGNLNKRTTLSLPYKYKMNTYL